MKHNNKKARSYYFFSIYTDMLNIYTTSIRFFIIRMIFDFSDSDLYIQQYNEYI